MKQSNRLKAGPVRITGSVRRVCQQNVHRSLTIAYYI